MSPQNFSFAHIKFLFSFFFLFSFTPLHAQELQPVASPKVCITQITHHDSLDKIRKGILDQLQKEGYTDSTKLQIVYDNAQGSNILAAQIAQKFSAQNPAVLIAITTPSAQSLAKLSRSQNIPLLFVGVTDPIAAKIITSYEHEGAAITGVVDFPPLEKQLQMMQKLLPTLRSLGVLYNPSEANSLCQVQMLRQITKKQGVSLVEAAVNKMNDITAASQSLIEKVDAILLPLDNMLASSIEAIDRVCRAHGTPLFASDDASVRKGAIAAICYNQYDMGRQAGALAARVLRGEKAENIPVASAANLTFYYNAESAKRLRITLPQTILDEYPTAQEVQP